jgi:P27 family predicted phage terminase small subunit
MPIAIPDGVFFRVISAQGFSKYHMARRGRPPKPEVLHWLNGDPSKKYRYLNCPQGDSSKPIKPDGLDAHASEEWDLITELLDGMRLLSRTDVRALTMYCEAYSRYQAAREQIAKTGTVLVSPSKFFYQSPFVGIMNKASAEMKSWLIEFGLTPSARARLAQPTESKGEDSPFKRLVR